jgi:hypothetical protein
MRTSDNKIEMGCYLMTDSYNRGLQASSDGFAHELIVAGLLMKRYKNVSLVDLPLSRYDIITVLKDEDSKENMIRAQVKTARTSISFTGGSRGGIDREYKSGVKEYVQSTETSDVVIGIHPNPKDEGSFDLYFVPTILIGKLGQKSISIKKVQGLKNNYEMLERCKDERYVLTECEKLRILSSPA